MNLNEIELQKREIEVLKICQHPNIIRLLDVFENPEYIYIGKIKASFVKIQFLNTWLVEICLIIWKEESSK